MTKIKRFEDLITWQKARILANKVFTICENKELKNEYGLTSQIKRSSISIMANIAEGFGRHSLKEAKQFYITARGSLAETQSHLYVLLDLKHISNEIFCDIYNNSEEVNKLLNGLISNLIKMI